MDTAFRLLRTTLPRSLIHPLIHPTRTHVGMQVDVALLLQRELERLKEDQATEISRTRAANGVLALKLERVRAMRDKLLRAHQVRATSIQQWQMPWKGLLPHCRGCGCDRTCVALFGSFAPLLQASEVLLTEEAIRSRATMDAMSRDIDDLHLHIEQRKMVREICGPLSMAALHAAQFRCRRW